MCYRHQIRLVHARSHVATAMGLLVKGVLGCKLLFDVRGLLAEEYADAGHWSTDEFKYRLTKRVEQHLFQRADALVMLTQRIKTLLVQQETTLSGRADAITVIPCCADTGRFLVSDDERARYRQQRGWGARIVLTYVGKIGTWYLYEEMAQFFAVAYQYQPRFFFQILTQSDPELMEQSLCQEGVDPSHYDICCVSQEALPLILASSDAGIAFIRPCYSKQASSPTKVGEYLAAGLPVVANAGIGDCDAMIGEQGLGLVLQDFSQAEYHRAVRRLNSLIADETMAQRCREFAQNALSLSQVGGPRYTALYQELLR
ncbi:MAG: hypothetical protein ETSY1_33565 [Candidatus Entotheonella factor]|uniref:Glycosyltransferase subfamily 4-like N-terminal domain-containing protein n=1 Tax=Entotheonella factor TaxID=1429438 RepID=W4LAK4_ENTF1|nr:MAG: hypothetical protein ETSY1_33565 [Candidatus Entotheonella factor]